MSDEWNFYQLLVDSEPASIFVDLGIAREAPLARLPNMAYLRVRMNSPRPDGLSSQDEYDTLIKLEHSVTAAVEAAGPTVYVGRNTSGGHRDFFFYTGDGSVERALELAMKDWPNYDFETGTRSDAEWSTYFRFLHPSPEDIQRMGNRDVIDRLLENGDQIDLPRIIDHVAVFKTAHGREAFAQHLSAEGYSISRTNDINGEFEIEFDRIDRPDQIDDITIALYRAARENDGDYDGWGCLTTN